MKFSQHLIKRPRIIVYTLIALLAILVSNKLGISVENLGGAWDNAGVLWSEMFPPDFSVVTKRASWSLSAISGAPRAHCSKCFMARGI